MPKYVDPALMPYFFKRHTKVLTGYKFSIYGTDDYKFITNSVDIGTYTALSIKRGSIKTEEGTVLNELEIGLDNVNLEFKTMVMNGILDNKVCKVYLVFIADDLNTILGEHLVYIGSMDAPKGDEHWVTVSIKPFPIFERMFPRRTYQVNCNWRFCDNFCGLNLVNYQDTVTLTADSTGLVLAVSPTIAENYYTPGYAQITSGEFISSVRPILSNDTSSVTLRIPFFNTIPAGTTVLLQKLCAKNPITCDEDFNNFVLHFGGYPHMPSQPVL